MKRWLLFLICLVCCEGIALAVDELTYNGFTYKAYSDGGTITGYSGEEQNLSIPSSLNGTTITELEKISNNNITSLYIPDNIKLDQNAIKECSELNVLIIENGEKKNYVDSKQLIYQSSDYIRIPRSIIIFSNSIDRDKLVNNSKCYGPKTITVELNDHSPVSCSIYISGTTFTSDNYGDLLYALTKHGVASSNITSISWDFASDWSLATGFNPASVEPHATITAGSKIYENSHEITDLTDYASVDENVVFEKYSYTRNNTQYWNSVCLPFPISESMFPTGTKIYSLNTTQSDASQISLKRIATASTELPAGTPCFINSTEATWTLEIAKEKVTATVPIAQEAVAGWQLVGSFTEQTIGQGKYKLNSEGTAFGTTAASAKIYPYRCYLQPVSAGGGAAPARLSVSIEENDGTTETVDIDQILPEGSSPSTPSLQLYDLFGRPRRQGSAGFYVRPTRH